MERMLVDINYCSSEKFIQFRNHNLRANFIVMLKKKYIMSAIVLVYFHLDTSLQKLRHMIIPNCHPLLPPLFVIFHDNRLI